MTGLILKCISCGTAHPIEYFNRDRSRDTGRDPRCKDCTRKACRATFRKNHVKHIRLKRRWKAENPEAHAEINRAYRQAHPEKSVAYTASYRKRLKLATPAWVDKREIARVRAACPAGHKTVLIEPLLGEDRCGLNVPWNLHYVPIASVKERPKASQEVCHL